MELETKVKLSDDDYRGYEGLLTQILQDLEHPDSAKESIKKEFRESFNLIAQKSFDKGREFERTQPAPEEDHWKSR